MIAVLKQFEVLVIGLYLMNKHNMNQEHHLDTELAYALPNAIIFLNEKMQIQWWNPVAEKFFLLTREHQDKTIQDLIPTPEFLSYLKNKTKRKVALEITAPKHPNTRLSIVVLPYQKNCFLLVANDITHTYQLEHIRQDFVANVSHELRTPLTVIKGYLETMLEEDKTSVKPFLLQMHKQTTRIENLVSDLLLLAKLESETDEIMQFQKVTIKPLLLSIANDAKFLSGEQHEITTEIENDLNLYGHENELRSAFSNLVFNAVRYTPAGGKITIKWFSDKHGAHLHIIDTGIGIASEHIPRLTERFYRIDKGRSRDAGGTGLGLAIVKHVLIRHKAELKVQSKIGKGSIFQCDFVKEMIC